MADLVLNNIVWLDNIGRAKRSNKNERLENFLTDLQRLTIVHETDHGGSYYRFATSTAGELGDEESKPVQAKEAPPKKADEKPQDSKKDSALDGDKGMSDHANKGAEHANQRAKQSSKVDLHDPKASQAAQMEGQRRAAGQDGQQDGRQQQQQQQQVQYAQQPQQPYGQQQYPQQPSNGQINQRSRENFVSQNAPQIPTRADRQMQASQNSLQADPHTLDMGLGRPVTDNDDTSSGEHTKVDEQQ